MAITMEMEICDKIDGLEGGWLAFNGGKLFNIGLL